MAIIKATVDNYQREIEADTLQEAVQQVHWYEDYTIIDDD